MKLNLRICLLSALVLLSLFSCSSKYEHNRAGFEKIDQDIKKKFGTDAYYTSISLTATGTEMQGYALILDKSESADDIRQEKWILDGGMWTQGGFSNMQVDANKPGFYKFQLDKEVNLPLLGELIEKSKQEFTANQSGDEPILKLAIVNTNNTVVDENQKFRYTVILQDKKSDETHSFTYGKNGEKLISN